jgi:hypothetical protein
MRFGVRKVSSAISATSSCRWMHALAQLTAGEAHRHAAQRATRCAQCTLIAHVATPP